MYLCICIFVYLCICVFVYLHICHQRFEQHSPNMIMMRTLIHFVIFVFCVCVILFVIFVFRVLRYPLFEQYSPKIIMMRSLMIHCLGFLCCGCLYRACGNKIPNKTKCPISKRGLNCKFVDMCRIPKYT